MKIFVRVLQIVGVFVFIFSVIVTVLFVEGYQYDSETHWLVKKSVVFFESLPKDSTVLVDGKEWTMGVKGEFRMLSGKHVIEIKKDGFLGWEKSIVLEPDSVMNFGEIKLLPASKDKMSFVKGLGGMSGFSQAGAGGPIVLLENKNLKYFKYYDLNDVNDFKIIDASIKIKPKKLAAVSDKMALGLDSKGLLFEFDFEDNKVIYEEGASSPVFVDMAAGDEKVFAATRNGDIYEVSGGVGDSENVFNAGSGVRELFSVQSQGSYNLFLFRLDRAKRLVVTDSGYSVVFQEDGVTSAYLDDKKLYYTTGAAEIRMRDLVLGENQLKKKINQQIYWMSRIADTNAALFLTPAFVIQYCDRDYENCKKLGSLSGPITAVSKDRTVFFTVKNGNFTLFDFGESSVLPAILEDLLSGIF